MTPPQEFASTAAARCPLCEQNNHCKMAAGEDASRCWCMHAPVSPLALARVADNDRHRRCVCAACAQAALTGP
ncbi:MAG: cysteine-rich CWC family protein [Burkholderiales bacterium]|nr:cysteine-rich CWC family protein [Burkholderiales bacterium]